MVLLRLAVALCAALLLAPAAARAEGFGLPVDLSEPQSSKMIVDGNGDDPGTLCWKPGAAGVDVAVNQAGDAVVAWYRRGDDDVIRVQAAYRFRGGEFGPAQTIGTARRCYNSDLGRLDAGIEDSGSALVTWPGRDETSGEAFIQAAELAPDDAWSQPMDLAPGGEAPRLALSPSGHAVIAFDRSTMSRRSVEALVRTPAGVFGPPRTLSDPGSTTYLRSVAINDEGAAVVGWEDTGPPGEPGEDSALVAVRPAGGEFTTQRRVSEPAERVFGPGVTVAPDGRVTTVFQRRNGTSSEVPELRLLRPDGTPEEATEPLPVMGEIVFGVGVVTDDAGTALAYWTECRPTPVPITCALGIAERRFGTPLSGPSFLPEGAGALAAGPGGEIVASQRIDGELRVGRLSDSGYEDPQAVRFGPGDVSDEAIAVGGDGVPLVAWSSKTDDELERVRVSTWDTEPPSLEPAVPATATVGERVAMSATAADPTGTTIEWDFGDSATAGGPEVSHAYAAAGRYAVTITATDGARNVRTATRVIEVSAPRPDGGGGGAGGGGGGGGTPLPPGPIVEPAPRSTDARVVARFSRRGRKTRIRRLAVTHLPATAAVTVRCIGKGRGCPFSRKRWASTASGWRNVRRAFGRRTTLRAGTVIEIRITAPGLRGQLVRYTLRRSGKPRVSLGCLGC